MTIFPPELVDDILDYSADDPQSLETYSLVSQAWVSRCRSHLFRQCDLRPSRIAPFCDLLRSSDCTFLPHVRCITKIKHFDLHGYDTYNKFATDLGRLINVRELQMEFRTAYLPERLDPFLCTAFPKITRLVLDSRRIELPTPLVNMICLFPALQEVDMKWTRALEDIPADALTPRELGSLIFSEYSAGQMLAWLDAAGQLPKIHSLTMFCLRGPDVPVVRKALQQIGDELRDFEIIVQGTSEDSSFERVETLKMIDLSLHRNLKTLRILDSSISSEAEETSLWILKTIMKLASSALEHVTLDLDLSRPTYEKGYFDWEALDAFLSPARFPRLRSVVIECGQHDDHDYSEYALAFGTDIDEGPEIDDEHEYVREALPLLADLKLLQTDW
ncbi:hypothetical protein B0H12DRAFT_1320090 [Mycena haematopus]|nr:hypothetical protein B0H12DRAFT_1320090 [Mycena haematopus]